VNLPVSDSADQALLEDAQAGSRRAIRPRNRARIIGLTGAPGAGKSTLTGHLAKSIAANERVAVIAIDPSSPVSGGAILGDRIRMDPVLADADVFIRSMATRGSEGGLSAAAPAAFRLLDAVGFDVIIVETVGVGQVEVDIAAAADTTLVVVTPGWGDAVQANKAGLLEVADIFAINKSDRPGAADTRRDLELMLDLTVLDDDGWRPPIIATVGTSAEGIAELVSALDDHWSLLNRTEQWNERRRARVALEVRSRVEMALASRLAATMPSDGVSELVDDVVNGEAPMLDLVDHLVTTLLTSDD
jgi:LAO/AO transport system kinase